MKTKGKLYLIPCTLGSEKLDEVIPLFVKSIIQSLKYFVVENSKSARQFLKLCEIKTPQQDLIIFELDKHDVHPDYSEIIKSFKEGNNIGLISEAGAPAIADPGADIVRCAHEKEIRVIPLTGPSAIFLALMASGLNGQNFCFHGYLPIEKNERIKKIKDLERDSSVKNQTQLFIETPYRNNNLLSDISSICKPTTLLCLACDITLQSEMIKTQSISSWKKQIPDLNKRPCVFLLLANR